MSSRFHVTARERVDGIICDRTHEVEAEDRDGAWMRTVQSWDAVPLPRTLGAASLKALSIAPAGAEDEGVTGFSS